VRAVLAETGFPGMKVLQFAFGEDARNPYLPHNYPHRNCVVYTGTHDNNTTRGWFNGLAAHEREHVVRYLGATELSLIGRAGAASISERLMRLASSSIANTAIVPPPDVLDLGRQAPINPPGHPEGNWTGRVRAAQLNPSRADCLAELTTLYGRG